MTENYILAFIFGGLFYGFIVFMAVGEPGSRLNSKWLYTIPVWPLTLVVLLVRISWRGIKVTLGI